ncbi:NAD(P)H-binding protein [Phytomonospora sp. NPDC050363]|uniref:SDR family oxidoreductase n=1 Tax=Phytomonospora sp. NPDC050363 TaxID=3155642 RepID=UPI0033FD2CFF
MTKQILVTGGSGRLGRVLLPLLQAAGDTVRALSRTGSWRGDLTTGEGLAAAVAGVDTIVHCATTNGRGDVESTRNLIEAALRAGRPHLVYVSIVGVDRVAIPYYRAKLACERLVEESGLPWTIQRATQFHDLIVWMCASQRWSPAIVMPKGVSFQPIDTRDVATRIAELTDGPQVNRPPDMGGPEVRDASDLARAYVRARSGRKPVVALPMPGAGIRGYRQGLHLAPGHAVGQISFDRFLAA